MPDEFDPETQEDSVYNGDAREKSYDNDEMDAREEAFLRGLDDDINSTKQSGDIGEDLFGEEEDKEKKKE